MLKERVKQLWALALVALLIAAPIGLYIHKFGLGYWDKHEKWGELGSYFGGVVTPILTGITLVFLLLQLKYLAKGLESERKHRIQTDTNAEVDYFIGLISEKVTFIKLNSELSFKFDKNISVLDDEQERLVQLWNCLYIALAPFRDEKTYNNQLLKGVNKTKAVVGHKESDYLDFLLRLKAKIPVESCYFSSDSNAATK